MSLTANASSVPAIGHGLIQGLSPRGEATNSVVHPLVGYVGRGKFMDAQGKGVVGMKIKAVIGIDPGKSGAAALIPSEGEPLVADWPGDPVAAAEILRDWSIEFDILLLALESVHAMPKQGVSSTFSFGQNLGQWQGIVSALGLPCMMPRPTDWQKGMIKKADGADTKAISLTVARRSFPGADLSRKKDHGRADALLLAYWAKRQGG